MAGSIAGTCPARRCSSVRSYESPNQPLHLIGAALRRFGVQRLTSGPGRRTLPFRRRASVCVMVHAASDPKNTMRAPVVAAKGATVFRSSRPSKIGLAWGNYNTTCVDSTDQTIFWTYQEYATSDVPSRYTTCWAAFKLK
jgi:hypothetical protein